MKHWLLILLAGVFLTGCTPSNDTFSTSQIIMDTLVEVKINGVSQEKAKQGAEIVFAEFNRIDKLMSKFKPESAVSLLNKNIQPEIQVDAELYELLKRANEISEATKGAFDVTIEPVLNLYGFGIRQPAMPDKQSLNIALAKVGYQKISFAPNNTLLIEPPPVSVDLGGIAEGYALKTAAALLKKENINCFLINAGGDIITAGKKKDGSLWRLGIKNPRGEGIIGSMEVTDSTVVTSGDYERFFWAGERRIHHIVDPKSGEPAPLCQSVTIVHPDPIAADAYSTGIFVMGPQYGLRLVEDNPDLEALIIAQDGTITKSSGFKYETQQN